MKSVVAVCVIALLACLCAGEKRFEGKNILVTGGSSGIGFQTALQFAQEAGNVIIVARNKTKLTEAKEKILKDELVKKNNGKVLFYAADLSQKKNVAGLTEYIKQHFDVLDVAVNSAGISGPLGMFIDSKDLARKNDPVLNNVYATLYAIAIEEALMVEKNTSGVIINVAGLSGVMPDLDRPRYGAAQHAIVGLTNGIALGHIDATEPPYIRVNAVAPAAVGTPFLFNQAKYYNNKKQPWEGEPITSEDDPIWKKFAVNFTGPIPMGRIAKPYEIANTILWLCTEKAHHISGDTIYLDGGVWSL